MKKLILLLAICFTIFWTNNASAQLITITKLIADSVTTDTTGIDSLIFSTALKTVSLYAEDADARVWFNTYTGKGILLPAWVPLDLTTQRYNISKIYLKKKTGAGMVLVAIVGGY